jgi:hypothetical protein
VGCYPREQPTDAFCMVKWNGHAQNYSAVWMATETESRIYTIIAVDCTFFQKQGGLT